MFSALKKLTRINDERCSAPVPMSSSLQKKFSRGVHFNMKILIKGDRNVGKSCLLQRLQGGPFIEEYVPTDQIQVAPIHWTYKNTDHIVKVEVWEVVDKGRTKKKSPLGLKLENQSISAPQDEGLETPVLDATFLDVYKNASGVILMLDITKPWTFEYVVKELSVVPADLPVVVLGNHCDMQHHRQVHSHHIEAALEQAKHTRTAVVRYAESSMRNGFGLRLLHKFLSVPFLRLQRTSLLEQLQRNQRDVEDTEKELDDFQCSEEAHYDSFVERLASARRQSAPAPRASHERSPSIVLGAGKPIVPANVNPLLAQSLNPMGIKAQHAPAPAQSRFVSSELLRRPAVSLDMTPARPAHHESSEQSTPSTDAKSPTGALDEFYAGALDSSFLDDLTPMPSQEAAYETDSDDDTTNPKVTIEQDDVDLDYVAMVQDIACEQSAMRDEAARLEARFAGQLALRAPEPERPADYEYPLWAGDASARRSPEGGEDPDFAKEPNVKTEKKHKKKKSKDKDKGDCSEKSEKKEKKSKHKKSKSQKKPANPQQGLLDPTPVVSFYYDEEYDSL